VAASAGLGTAIQLRFRRNAQLSVLIHYLSEIVGDGVGLQWHLFDLFGHGVPVRFPNHA